MGIHETYNTIKDLGFNPEVIIDCGVAWGDWSAPVKEIFPNSFLIGIDANKWSEENTVRGTDVTHIEVLSDQDGKEMVFYRKKDDIENGKFCTGDSLFKENTNHYLEHNTIESVVKTKSLKSILEINNKKSVDLIKLDTQGSEILILKGLGDLLKTVEFIEMECSLVEYNIGGCSFYDVIDFLKPDFEIFDIIDLHKHHGRYLCQIDVVFQNKNSKFKRLM